MMTRMVVKQTAVLKQNPIDRIVFSYSSVGSFETRESIKLLHPHLIVIIIVQPANFSTLLTLPLQTTSLSTCHFCVFIRQFILANKLRILFNFMIEKEERIREKSCVVDKFEFISNMHRHDHFSISSKFAANLCVFLAKNQRHA